MRHSSVMLINAFVNVKNMLIKFCCVVGGHLACDASILFYFLFFCLESHVFFPVQSKDLMLG